MAQNKPIFSLILLALIIFCHGFQSIEGRYLKIDEGTQHLMKHGDFSTTNGVVSGASEAPSLTPSRDVSGFKQPTTGPGHSPGVGHSIHN